MPILSLVVAFLLSLTKSRRAFKFMPLKILVDVRHLEMHLSFDDQQYRQGDINAL